MNQRTTTTILFVTEQSSLLILNKWSITHLKLPLQCKTPLQQQLTTGCLVSPINALLSLNTKAKNVICLDYHTLKQWCGQQPPMCVQQTGKWLHGLFVVRLHLCVVGWYSASVQRQTCVLPAPDTPALSWSFAPDPDQVCWQYRSCEALQDSGVSRTGDEKPRSILHSRWRCIPGTGVLTTKTWTVWKACHKQFVVVWVLFQCNCGDLILVRVFTQWRLKRTRHWKTTLSVVQRNWSG